MNRAWFSIFHALKSSTSVEYHFWVIIILVEGRHGRCKFVRLVYGGAQFYKLTLWSFERWTTFLGNHKVTTTIIEVFIIPFSVWPMVQSGSKFVPQWNCLKLRAILMCHQCVKREPETLLPQYDYWVDCIISWNKSLASTSNQKEYMPCLNLAKHSSQQ